ncbi:hypothetical protein OROHE_016871 [Orobanche hederae]
MEITCAEDKEPNYVEDGEPAEQKKKKRFNVQDSDSD